MDKYKRQMALENEGVALGVKKYRDAVREKTAKGSLTDLPPGIHLMHRAIAPLQEALDEFMKPARGGGRLQTIRKFLRQLDPYEVAYITARRMINAITAEESLQNVCVSLGTMLYDHLEYLRFKEGSPKYLKTLEDHLKTMNEGHRRTVIMRAKRKAGIDDLQATRIDKLHIGTKLVDLFIQATGLVKKVRKGEDGKGTFTIKGTDSALEWITKHHAKCELLEPVFLPMIIPPVPWDSPFGGGFVSNGALLTTKLIKTPNSQYLESIADHDMPLVYRTVNALQETSWRINRRLMEVMQEACRIDSGLAGIPKMDHEEPLPPTSWVSDEEFQKLKEEHPEVVKSWKIKSTEVYTRREKNKTQRIQMNQKLWLAEKFVDEPEIFFVWTMDWRGRLYPVQSFVNPQGDDSGKALLEFAEGKPLGEEGFRWLKIHLANKFGYDKVSFDDRVSWVEDHHEDILRWAEDPLGNPEWDQADSPWCFLAACLEYLNVSACENPYAYESRIPIAMDGTCNGLQNFSAMLRDAIGGKAVNLTPSDKPQDVYQEVVNVVSGMIEKDTANGVDHAHLWVEKLDRSIAKRNVMTVPYGVSLYGMRDQIQVELEKRNGAGGRYLECDHKDEFKAAVYLADRMYEGIGQVVIAARKAMDWLQDVAKIASKKDLPLSWTTPAGFPVEQHYKKQKNKRIETFWGAANLRTQISLNFDTEKLDSRKQAAGISPNFVHSMDASHLMLTVNKALDVGITSFAMIHDSYATHAADTGILASILREAFVEQYSEDVLESFKQEVSQQIAEELPEVPPKGDLDLNEVLASPYFFA